MKSIAQVDIKFGWWTLETSEKKEKSPARVRKEKTVSIQACPSPLKANTNGVKLHSK